MTSRSGDSGNCFDLAFSTSLRLGLILEEFGRVDVRVHVALALKSDQASGSSPSIGLEVIPAHVVASLDERRVHVDQILERQATIDEILDGLLAESLHVGSNPVPVVGRLVHHLAVGEAEPDVILEEVVMTVDVGHHELLIDLH